MVYRAYDENQNRIMCSFRIRPEIFDMLQKLSKSTGVSQIDYIEIGLLEIFKNFNLISNSDIDYNQLVEVTQNRIKRKQFARLRCEAMSKALFIRRVRKDVYKMIKNKVSVKQIKEFVEIYYLEAKTFTDSQSLLLEMQQYRLIDIETIKEIENRLREYDNIDIINKLENMKTEEVVTQ